jgi:hypothetical protein
MREWIVQEGLATETELENLENKIISEVRTQRREAWNAYQAPILKEKEKLIALESALKSETHNDPKVQLIYSQLEQNEELGYKDLISAGRKINLLLAKHPQANLNEFKTWYQTLYDSSLQEFHLNSTPFQKKNYKLLKVLHPYTTMTMLLWMVVLSSVIILKPSLKSTIPY